MKSLKYILVFILLFSSCSRFEITPPEDDEANLAGTTVIADSVMKKMEGIYDLGGGSGTLGSHFVCKVSKYRVSFFSEKEGIFIILKYGYKSSDGSIQFAGSWRYSETPDQGKIHGSISASEGASDLLISGIPTNIKFQGIFSEESLTIQYERAFSAYAASNPFIVLGHHGILTTTNPPFCENSVNAVLNAEDYGVNGLEYDIRMTSDHVPICIHDPSINTRLTQKGPLSGTWDMYSFDLITQYIRLLDGQQLPSVEQALNAFIDNTNMKYFWMDIKGNVDIFQYLEPIVRNAYARAAAQNRDVVIFAGMPSDDVIEEYHKQPTYATLPTLCEETVDKAIANGSQFFGPRYTLGLLLDDVDRAHANGIKVITWTLNSKAIIQAYLQDGKFDGFITDYPAYVIYDFYTMF